ncbi:MAG: endonuclease/exonuclease/phosphatase family protein [Pararhodobacter sp.]|nr:endonuclease/exonuclease/phosphatase family protein [Pararhodobacter sp.]
MRLAVFHTELGRDGPGLLLRDIRRGAEDVLRARDTILAAQPDVVVLLGFDHDLDMVALSAFQRLLADAGLDLPYRFSRLPNRGMATGLDLVGDGRTGTADDAQGYGSFAGASGMAILSRLAVMEQGFQDHSAFLWRDLPGALLPGLNGRPYPSEAVFEVQRLATTGIWSVPVLLPDGSTLTLLTWHAGPPVFGGPHQRNRRRNHDETLFWVHYLNGDLPFAPPPPPFALIGNSNIDPGEGDGMHAAMRRLLAHPALQDPTPRGRTPDGAIRTATAHFSPWAGLSAYQPYPARCRPWGHGQRPDLAPAARPPRAGLAGSGVALSLCRKRRAFHPLPG